MKQALHFHSKQFELIDKDTYATTDDFQRVFAREMTDLLRLSLLLTADAEDAERSLILAMRDCSTISTVSKEWARIWARRTVIRKAIQLVVGTEDETSNDSGSGAGPDLRFQPGDYRVGDLQDSLDILALPNLERLVYVICDLERYSIMDCALLLGSSPKEVDAARIRAINQVVLPKHGTAFESTRIYLAKESRRHAVWGEHDEGNESAS